MAEPTRDVTKAQLYYADFMADVLVYTVVLNLFVEFVDAIVIDSFLVSLLTAVVMKVMIDAIGKLVQRLKDRFGRQEGNAAHVALVASAWAVMFFSKIAILVVVDLIFEEDVDLGGFLNVLILVIAMMLARRASSAVYVRLGSEGHRSAG